MHIEFALQLEAALNRAFGEPARKFLQSRLSSENGNLLRAFQIGECPPQVDAFVTSSITFALAKEFSDRAPELLANRIVNDWPSADFEIAIGGGGHLNATPRGDYAMRWFDAAVHAPASVLFSPRSIFAAGASAAPESLSVNWDSLLRDAARSPDKNISALVAGVGSSSDLDKGRRMMLLGIIADPEIDSGPFLAGLSGSQNLPWYFQRRQQDGINFTALIDEKISATGNAPAPQSIVPPFGRELMSSIAGFRLAWLEAVMFHSPQRLFGHLLRMLKNFYQLYNQPRFRALSSEDFTIEQLVFLKHSVAFSAELLALSLKSLDLN